MEVVTEPAVSVLEAYAQDGRVPEESRQSFTDSTGEKPLVLEEVYLERITIDGICGVY